MLAMTRLQSDSFLPSGAIPDINGGDRVMPSLASHLNRHPASIISPLALPHAVNNFSYFHESSRGILSRDHSHSPSVPGISGATYQINYIPDKIPSVASDERSTSSLPTKPHAGLRVASPSVVPSSNHGVRSPLGMMSTTVSAEDLLRRKESQNRRLLESWLAERAHLEANRARADEVYQEERAIMDDERMLWIEEKARLEKDLSEWKSRAEAAEKSRDELANFLKSLQVRHNEGGGPLGTAGVMGGIRGGGSASPEKSAQPQSTVGSGGSSDRVPQTVVPASSLLGSTMPESKPFIPLDPRMQGPSPQVGSPKPQTEQAPSIDIHEVIPELEGIRVRPGAVQRPTFTDEKPSSPSAPPAGLRKPSPPARDQPRPRPIPAELTKEALRAAESDRLTMHAGHTPNHSMSLSRLHTVQSTDATNTTNSPGARTPKGQPPESSQGDLREQPSQGKAVEVNNLLGIFADSEARDEPLTVGNIDATADVNADGESDDHDHDPELKGPLHLRNLPAVDEPFLKSLNSRLEKVLFNDIAPSVLKNAAASTSSENRRSIEPASKDLIDNLDDEEEDIPLKLKKSSNFGQPLGQLR
ncbi:hypothetical protein GGS23DRAFT_188270 [Durotheca rogersii]|uniref:uncharacterized protein n=1 Tax=Durotheca rogersii TaxID=419775 RepID=UPI00222079D6|nr:uncharacterized protein GGS23DRAFT_188270 [Durotheca rogersii]KAI5867672.1 hypothetical protein GGS23DRAFT_188270 [Durotheca rogersii]